MKNFIQNTVRKFGYEFRKFTPGGDEPVERSKWLLSTNDSPIIFDVGAHQGEFCEYARNVFPKSKIFAFEPFPQSREIIKNKYKYDKNITIEHYALSDEEINQTLYSNHLDATNSLLEADPEGRAWWGNVFDEKNKLSVESTTICNYCQNNKIDQIGLLKLDIQGAELKALKGAHKLLKENKIDLVYAEFIVTPAYINQAKTHETLSYLGELNYNIVDIFHCDRRAGRLYQMDILFISSKLSAVKLIKPTIE